MLAAATVVVLAGLVVGGILLSRDEDPPTDYDARTEDDFMATCTTDAEAAGLTGASAYCGCTFAALREQVPYDRFVEIDAALAADPTAVPDVLDRIRTDCYLQVERGVVPTTVTPTTAVPEEP